MNDKLLVLTTYPDEGSALATARRLVKEHLAACVNVLPSMTSVYEWQDEACEGNEHLLLIKTTQTRYAALEASIQQTHPYELPEIIATPISHGLPEYFEWIERQTSL